MLVFCRYCQDVRRSILSAFREFGYPSQEHQSEPALPRMVYFRDQMRQFIYNYQIFYNVRVL